MKKFILFLFLILILPIYAQDIEYFINDYSGVLTQNQIDEIEPILKEIYDSGQAEFAIVIVDSLGGSDIDSYAYNLAEGNLGDEQKNNGLLLLIAIAERQYKFEVGRGLEPVLPDILLGRIGREYLEPNFKEGNYAKGILDSSIVIKQIVFNDEIFDEEVSQSKEAMAGIIFIIVWVVAILIFITASKNTRPSKKIKKEDYFTAAWILSQIIKGGKRGGGFSGGSGGFGGGSFGGGGAGGRW
jgi:uncharacterized protein